jgi:hypothetical protein
MPKYSVTAQYIIYVNRPKKTLKGNFTANQGGLSDRDYSDQLVLGTVRWEAVPQKRWPKVLKSKLAEEDHEARVSTDQLGSCDGQPGGWTS